MPEDFLPPGVGPIIRRPTDPERLRLLQQKLGEYRKRHDQNPAKLDTLYKVALLSAILEHGQVRIAETRRNLLDANGKVDPLTFANACIVINDYVETGGQFSWGGTGLRG
jgi:hypothetical protein